MRAFSRLEHHDFPSSFGNSYSDTTTITFTGVATLPLWISRLNDLVWPCLYLPPAAFDIQDVHFGCTWWRSSCWSIQMRMGPTKVPLKWSSSQQQAGFSVMILKTLYFFITLTISHYMIFAYTHSLLRPPSLPLNLLALQCLFTV